MHKLSKFGESTTRGEFMKKKKLISILMIIVFPISVFAYSNQVIIGGETIGIEVH